MRLRLAAACFVALALVAAAYTQVRLTPHAARALHPARYTVSLIFRLFILCRSPTQVEALSIYSNCTDLDLYVEGRVNIGGWGFHPPLINFFMVKPHGRLVPVS